MITTNPFAENILNIPSYAIQGFLILMVVFTIGGVILDMMHKKNVKFCHIIKHAPSPAQHPGGLVELFI